MAKTLDAHEQKPQPWKKWLQLGIMLLVLGFLAKAATTSLSGDEIRAALARFEWSHLPLILGSSLLFLCLNTLRCMTLMAPLSDVPGWAIARGYMGSQPASMVPGGVALRVAMFTRLGVPAACSSAVIINASAMDQLLMVLVTAVAALWFAKARLVAALMLSLIIVLALLAAIPATRHGVKNGLRKLASFIHWEKHAERFIDSLDLVANPRTLTLAGLLTLTIFATAVIEFMFVLKSIGVQIPFWSALLAYTLPSMLGRLFITPGGIGVTEGGMIGVMSTVAGINRNTAAAGSALFRLSDSVFQALVGALVYLVFWRGSAEKSWLPTEAKEAVECNRKTHGAPRLTEAAS